MSPTPPLPELRIFLASPGDTAPMRAMVHEVIASLQSSPLHAGRFTVKPLSWDDPRQPVPCSFLHNPQWDVLDHTGDPAECDLVIGIFRHHFGSPLPIDDTPTARGFGRSPDGDAWTGSEWELHRAEQVARAMAASGAALDVQIYRDTSRLELDPSLPLEQFDAATAQARRVAAFFHACKDDSGSILRGVNEFAGEAAFLGVFRPRLEAWIAQWLQRPPVPRAAAAAPQPPVPLSPGQQALRQALLQDQPPADDAITDARNAVPNSLAAYLLRRWAEWNPRWAERLTLHFVNLQLLTDRGGGVDGPRFAPRDDANDLAALLQRHADVRAWVLVGEPGGGKSTLLQHHEQRTALQALQALDQGRLPAEVGVYLRLADWRPADPPQPATWLAEQWQARYPELPPLPQFQRLHRVRWLLDGLNEIKCGSPAAWDAAVQALGRWAADWAAAGGLAPVFSVRSLDYSQTLSSAALEVHQVTVGLWTPEQVADYCRQRLGDERGTALFEQLQADPGLLELSRLPMNLAGQCEWVAEGFEPARDAAAMFAGLLWLRLSRAQARGELSAPGLLSRRDAANINQRAFWRQHLHHLPSEGALLTRLQAQALAMHQQADGAELSLPEAAVQPDLPEPLRSHWLQAVQALHLAQVDGLGQFRFTHQRWQEALAARALVAGGLPAALPVLQRHSRPQPLEPLADTCAALGLHDPLPLPTPSLWRQTLMLAGQQLRAEGADLAPWLAPVQAQHPALAAQMLGEPANAPPALVQTLADTLFRSSRDPAQHLRRRLEAARALGRDWPHPAYQRLQRPGQPACLLPAPSYWREVPAGTYPLGSAEGEADERPAQPAWTLPQGFRIAWAPVTNAEYQCFIDAGGYDDEAWWAPQGAAALAWFKGELVDEASITYWRERVTALRDDFDTALQRYFPNATEAAVEADLRRYAGWTAQETEDNLNAQFGAQRFSQPREWDAPAFYHSRQPVVGVCAWEAQAYCLWLSAASGQAVRLPTEAEWEAAARGPRGLAWPWGPDAPDAHRLNAYDSHLRRSSPVGVFPLADQAGADGAAPLADLAGNVWEWCASAYSHTLEPQVMHRPVGTDEAPDQPRAVRGGAWLSLPRHCRAGYRYWFHPPDRSGSLGFRVVICPI